MTPALNTSTAGSPRILIVDDSRAIQAIIRRVVEGMGYPDLQLQSATNGEQALRSIASFRPHLVLSDWHMPAMSGLEMLQLMRQSGHRHTKVGFITTETSPPLIDEARRTGAAFVLHKPFRDEDLVREIGNILQAGDAASAAACTDDLPPRKSPMTAGALEGLLRRTLGEIPFRLIEHAGLTADELTAQNMLAFFGSAGRPLTVVAVMDTRAVCIIGGGAAGLMPAVVRPAMAAGQPSPRMVELGRQFLVDAGQLMVGVDADGVQLRKSSMVSQDLPMLGEVLNRSQSRLDVRISVPGYGDGRLSLLGI